eukprot:GHVS01109150.1.p1 GENE.GHVS01109150.1~~GHVS01109150.1.p1  ORF type:complete len:192 (+),score=54.58 GHVS01109150.1:240-815(+)
MEDRRAASGGGGVAMPSGDVLVEMRPAGDEAVRSMLGQMLVAFGGEVVNMDTASDVALLKFPSAKAAGDFTLQGHTFTTVVKPPPAELTHPPGFPAPTNASAIPRTAMTPSTSESSPGDRTEEVSDVAAKPFQQMSITELYKATDTATKVGGREPLSESDMFYLFADANIMAPLLCGFMLLYCCGCMMGLA